MTPQERALIAQLFDRLAALESAPRDADAERAIAEGLARSPHAVYALVQSVLVQDEALKRADARIRELEGGDAEPPQEGSFLDSMRESLFGRGAPSRGSVPTVRPAGAGFNTPEAPSRYEAPAAPDPRDTRPGTPFGGSFLGTAAASAAGVIGGALLLDSIRSMMGHSASAAPSAAADPSQAAASPWTLPGTQTGSNDLARDAGLGDIGGSASDADTTRHAGLFDHASHDDNYDPGDDGGFDDGLDFGDSGFGDSDVA